MNFLIIVFVWLALFIACLLGITLSVPLQSPALILLGVASIFSGINLLRREKINNREESAGGKSSSWLLGLSLVAILYFISRALFSPVFDLGVEDLMLILSASALYLTGGYGVGLRSRESLKWALASVVIFVLLLHMGAAVFQMKGEEGYSLSPLFTGAVRSAEGSLTGMYGYYGSFANYMVIGALLCLSLAVWGRLIHGIRVALFIIGTLALVMGILSQSRSATLSLVVAFLVLVVMFIFYRPEGFKKWVYRCFLIVGGLGMLGGSLGSYWVFGERAHLSVKGELGMVFDSAARIPFWSMAGEQWVDHPFFGAGSRSYSYECFRYWSSNLSTGSQNPEFVHNEYLQLLADYGLVGLLLILSLLVWHFVAGFKCVHLFAGKVDENDLKHASNSMALSIAGMCGMMAMAVHICFDFRTHLLANLLLLVCCAIWVLPVEKIKIRELDLEKKYASRQRMGGIGLALVLFCLGFGAFGLGAQQLWAGLPLMENKMAKEDGAWVPQEVDRNVWVPALEKSLSRLPQWRRYQRLGTLYRLEAVSEDYKVDKEQSLRKAESAYLASIQRHRFNPIPRINLAVIYTQQKRWKKADKMYASASQVAKAREPWFRMHSKWGEMHHLWGLWLWAKGNLGEAEDHMLRALVLYQLSRDYGNLSDNRSWNYDYMGAVVSYTHFLDNQKRFDESEKYYDSLTGLSRASEFLRYKKLNCHYARHLYQKAVVVWHERKPEEALAMMQEAKAKLLYHRALVKRQVDDSWQRQMDDVQEVIDFLERAGVK